MTHEILVIIAASGSKNANTANGRVGPDSTELDWDS